MKKAKIRKVKMRVNPDAMRKVRRIRSISPSRLDDWTGSFPNRPNDPFSGKLSIFKRACGSNVAGNYVEMFKFRDGEWDFDPNLPVNISGREPSGPKLILSDFFDIRTLGITIGHHISSLEC